MSLDELRHEASDGTPAGDYLARSRFLRECQTRADAVFDFNGGGGHRHSVRLALAMLAVPLRIVYLRVPIRVALARFVARGTSVPFPDYGVDLPSGFTSMAEVLEDDLAKGFWTRHEGWTAIALDGMRAPEDILAELKGR